MNLSILYFILALAVAFFVAVFLYVYPKKKLKKPSYLLILLRFLSVVAILMLLINPKWEKQELSIQKPRLIVAVDNSASIGFVNGKEQVKVVLEKIEKDKELHDKFSVKYFSFGVQSQLLDSLSFSEPQTNPTELFQQLKVLNNESKTPILFVTDGNQTTGNSYEYYASKNPIYPIVIGDTTKYVDLAITQLNANQYAFLDNKFPVEIFTLYNGIKNVDAQLSIYVKKQHIFTKKLNFSSKNSSQNISLMLPAKEVGQHYYHAVISSLENEKNIQNNRKDFSVKVVDQQTNVLILSSFNHPDLGAIKKSIESNKQRKAVIKIASKESIDLSQYQLIILYQPTVAFTSIIKTIYFSKKNTVIITGTKTDWAFLNNVQQAFSKDVTKMTENYLASFNTTFPEFVIKDIGFDQLPPLKDSFGTLTFNVPYQSLLYQKIGNTTTEYPLLATYTDGEQKNVVLFGEGFWRWRMLNKIEKQSYKAFDNFWGALIQFTAATKETQQLQLDYKKLCFSNQQQLIKASFVDKNYKIDKKATIWLYLTDKQTKKTKKMPFYLNGDQYEIGLADLKPGKYSFKTIVENQEVKQYGNFKVLNYNVEQQFSTANIDKLERIAQRSGGEVIYTDMLDPALQNLVKNKNYQSIQKSKKISKPLIDWHWLLGFIILSLSVEWFIRKYRGLV